MASPESVSPAHFEFVWPRPRRNADGKVFLSEKATSFPCGGLTSASTVRTPFPLSGSVPIQLRLANWTSPDAPRMVMLNVKLNLGNNAGVGEYTAASTTSATTNTNSGAKNDPNAPQMATGKANKDFEFKTGLRFVNEQFFAGGGLCLQDIWAPGWAGHSDFGKVDQLDEGMNGTLHIEVAETEAYGAKEVVRRGYMCADVTFTREPLTHHQYSNRCHNDSIIVPTLSNSDTFPLLPTPTPLIGGPPPPSHRPHLPLVGSDRGHGGGSWAGWHGTSSSGPGAVKSNDVAARVGAAIGGSVAAVVVFLLFFLLFRRRMAKRNQSTAFANSDVETRPSPEELFAAGRVVPAVSGAGLRGGEGDAASQDGFEAAGRRAREEGMVFGDVKVKVEELEHDEGSVFGDEKEEREERLPSYVDVAGKGREFGREKI